jgi:hypothetical protein
MRTAGAMPSLHWWPEKPIDQSVRNCAAPGHGSGAGWRPVVVGHVAVAVLGPVLNKFCKHILPISVSRFPHDAQPVQLSDTTAIQQAAGQLRGHRTGSLSVSDVSHPACERRVRRILYRNIAVAVLLLERLQLLESLFPNWPKRDGVVCFPSRKVQTS